MSPCDANGTLVGWAGRCSSGTNCDVPNQRSKGFQCSVATCGVPSSGSGDGQLLLPEGLTGDPAGNLYIVDSSNHRIQVFDANGFKTKWGTNGVASGQFRQPIGVAATGGSVYVADTGNNRVQKFESNGVAQMVWGADVRLTASPGELPGFINTITLAPSSSQQSVITVQSLNQFAGRVSLSASCCFDVLTQKEVALGGVSVSVSPVDADLQPNGSAIANLTVATSGAPVFGKFLVHVKAHAVGIDREARPGFNVFPPIAVAACPPSLPAMFLKPALEALIAAKETTPPPAIVTVGILQPPDASKLDRTLVFRKLVCTSSFILCLSTTWVDVAVFPEPGFWRVFGGRKATFKWIWDH